MSTASSEVDWHCNFSDAEKLDEVRREIAVRNRVYPHWIEQNKIKSDVAALRIAILEEIARDYEAKLMAEMLI